MKNQTSDMTVGEFIDDLSFYPRDSELMFSGLNFYRLKRRGEDLVQVEFNEALYQTEDGPLVLIDLDCGDYEVEVSVRSGPTQG